MAGITLAQAQEQLNAWLAASLAVSKGQSYMMDGKQFTRVNADHIDRMVKFWEEKVIFLSGSADGTAVGRTYAKNGGGGRW